MSDLISRQAAIEAIRNIKAIKGTSDDKILLIDKAEAQTELMMLPSADRPQGWVDKAISIIDAMQKEGIIDYEQAWEFRMRARMKGADDE